MAMIWTLSALMLLQAASGESIQLIVRKCYTDAGCTMFNSSNSWRGSGSCNANDNVYVTSTVRGGAAQMDYFTDNQCTASAACNVSSAGCSVSYPSWNLTLGQCLQAPSFMTDPLCQHQSNVVQSVCQLPVMAYTDSACATTGSKVNPMILNFCMWGASEYPSGATMYVTNSSGLFQNTYNTPGCTETPRTSRGPLALGPCLPFGAGYVKVANDPCYTGSTTPAATTAPAGATTAPAGATTQAAGTRTSTKAAVSSAYAASVLTGLTFVVGLIVCK